MALKSLLQYLSLLLLLTAATTTAQAQGACFRIGHVVKVVACMYSAYKPRRKEVSCRCVYIYLGGSPAGGTIYA